MLRLGGVKNISAALRHYGWKPWATPEQSDQAEGDREMSIRLTWRPYMHNPRLPAKLARVSVPAHIVWGENDNLVPVECAGLYQSAIAGSQVTVLPNCGHSPQIEKPDDFVQTALAFL
jgi:pimeloyl-ACP methyl ester carboxylesterase